jgi:hypothetical protein
MLLCACYCPKLFALINPLDLHNNPMRVDAPIAHVIGEEQGMERSGNLPKDSYLVCGELSLGPRRATSKIHFPAHLGYCLSNPDGKGDSDSALPSTAALSFTLFWAVLGLMVCIDQGSKILHM